MSSLRKDLLDRRLWPLAAVLVAALVAVPLLTLKHAAASPTPAGAVPQVSIAGTTSAAGKGAAAGPRRHGRDRNGARPVRRGSDAFIDARCGGGVGVGAVVVRAVIRSRDDERRDRVADARSGEFPGDAGAPDAGVRVRIERGHDQGDGACDDHRQAGAAARILQCRPTSRSWTIYAVDVRVGANASAPVRRDVARLTPFPSAKRPEVMYMGVMAGGKQAAFALNGNVGHAGPGVCRPSVQVCSVIMLRAGQTETFTVPMAGGGQQRLVLRVAKIRSRVTGSHAEAFAAYERHSAAGLCDLALAEPMSYSRSAGTLTGMAGAACKDQPVAVPFPSIAQSS